jgi:hypothetical protein
MVSNTNNGSNGKELLKNDKTDEKINYYEILIKFITPLLGGSTIVSAIISYFGTENYIRIEHLPVSIASVFGQVVLIFIF